MKVTYWIKNGAIHMLSSKAAESVADDDNIRQWIEVQGVIVRPINRTHFAW